MANLNDFKLINKISEKYYSLGFKGFNIKEMTEINKKRFGFYLFILECITDNKDLEELIHSIIDTDFIDKVFHKGNNDLGIDAVYIDEENNRIMLFNFKFREKFNNNKSQELGSVIDCSKFLNSIYSENTDEIDEISKKFIKKIIEKYNSDDSWSTELFLISNENKPLDLNRNEIKTFIETYDLKITSITLDEIMEYISDVPDDISSKFLVDVDSVMTFEEESLSSSKSYLVKLPLITLIRITCKDEELRNNTNIEDYSILKGQELYLGLLYDNVRGYLGETKFNKNIIRTIDEDPNKFFMYNNGITITTKNINAKKTNGMKKFSCELQGFQIVNGGQTIRSIYKFLKEEFDDVKLSSAEILVRIFQTEKNYELTNNIAEYTNSQNAVSSINLKSISNIQIELERYLKQEGILYIRKSGDTGIKEENITKRISIEILAQLIYSKIGNPDRATNQKKALFDKYYDEIFSENLNFEEVKDLVEKYFNIQERYKESNFEMTNQKCFYILWISEIYDKLIDQSIQLLEKYLLEYKKEENISNSRKLIQKGFKKYIEDNIKNIF